MSGYGSPDSDAEHALIFTENGVEAHREALRGVVLTNCRECGELIPPARRTFAIAKQMKCEYCVSCQEEVDKRPLQKIRMLDRIL